MTTTFVIDPTTTRSLHDTLGALWCQWNGQTGTVKQVARVTKQLTADDLTRMLAERGITITLEVR